MTYSTAEARQQVLETLAEAAEQIGLALAYLSEAYEHLDEGAAERLEDALFQPVQAAYGAAKRTHSGFADRHQLGTRTFDSPSPVAPSNGTKGLVENAVEAAARAEATLVGLQDSMAPVEVGDAELRAGIAHVRELLAGIRRQAREFLRTLGR
jgi:hypothetical protein